MRIVRTLLAALVTCITIHSQNLPADQQTYERFRSWVNMQPVADQRSPDILQKYREHLKDASLSDTEINAQVAVIEQQAARLEVERWNRVLTSEKPIFNTNPNAFLVEIAKGRKTGTALDVGMGQGRNAIWLAQQGWDVTGFDPADKAVALARQNAAKLGVKLNTEIAREEDFNFGENRWDLILISYAGGRGFADRVRRALKPGGILVIEAFHRDATKGRPIGGAVVFDTGELPALFPQLRVVRYEEPVSIADFGKERVRLVRLCAEKPVQ